MEICKPMLSHTNFPVKFFPFIYGLTRLLQAKKGYPSLTVFIYPFTFDVIHVKAVSELSITGRCFFINFR